MVDEITLMSQTSQTEPISESMETTIPLESEVTEVGSEPTAQIPVSEPLATPTELEAEPIVETIPAETKQVEKEIKSESILEPIPEPEVKPEPKVEEFKPEPVSVSNSNEVKETKPELIPEVIPAVAVISKSKNLARELLIKARNMIQFRKRKKLDKIMTLFASQTKITNDEVEKFLHVSDATAERYLNTLEKENKIKQTGKTGKSVFYTKI